MLESDKVITGPGYTVHLRGTAFRPSRLPEDLKWENLTYDERKVLRLQRVAEELGDEAVAELDVIVEEWLSEVEGETGSDLREAESLEQLEMFHGSMDELERSRAALRQVGQAGVKGDEGVFEKNMWAVRFNAAAQREFLARVTSPDRPNGRV